MTLELPDIEALEFSPAELRLELACALYARGKISAVKGSHLCGLDLFAFQGALKERSIPRNYSIQELHKDVEALESLLPE